MAALNLVQPHVPVSRHPGVAVLQPGGDCSGGGLGIPLVQADQRQRRDLIELQRRAAGTKLRQSARRLIAIPGKRIRQQLKIPRTVGHHIRIALDSVVRRPAARQACYIPAGLGNRPIIGRRGRQRLQHFDVERGHNLRIAGSLNQPQSQLDIRFQTRFQAIQPSAVFRRLFADAV